MASSQGLMGRSPAGAVNLGAEASAGVDCARACIESLDRRFKHLERSAERQMAGFSALHSHVSRLDEKFEKNQVDLSYAQNQLEFVVVTLERLSGIVTNHTEQLRLFAGESGRRGAERTTTHEPKKLILTLAGWLYVPLVYFVKGIYTLLSPVITTAQSLSLFNSDVRRRLPENLPQPRWGNAGNLNLLEMLRCGSFDLASVCAQNHSTNPL
ncbi:unnamed protein product [Phytomonas sp. EM1]|nr:unnamed protein product [Phytomonas sp. EM1]|eukprot:CCW61047.1 unnamed protein product [Phytomonas sp. isolate EM1]